jgi:hypothetical protein
VGVFRERLKGFCDGYEEQKVADMKSRCVVCWKILWLMVEESSATIHVTS